jgi:hypothetical protein
MENKKLGWDVRFEDRKSHRWIIGLICVLVTMCILATVPLEHSPVEVSSADPTTTQNQTNVSIEFNNQSIDGSTVTVQSATLPSSGFIILDLSGGGVQGVLEEDAVAVSGQLSAGTYRNVTLSVNNSPPGGVANRTSLNNTGNYEAILYHDSNNNNRFEYLTSRASTDQPIIVGSGDQEHLVKDGARLTVRGSLGDPNATPAPSANIQFTDQRANGSVVTVESVTLPQGGFVAVHNESYLRPWGDPTQTVLGHSQYLPAGTHQNVSVELTNGFTTQGRSLVAVPSRDTNANQNYDYVETDGFRDVSYTADGEAVSDQAAIGGSGASDSSSTQDPPSVFGGPTTSPSTTAASSDTDTSQKSTSATATQSADLDESASNLIFSNIEWIIGVVLVVILGLYLLHRRG